MPTTNTHRHLVPVPRQPTDPTESAATPEEWCVACGFAHDPDTHCPDCTGVHQGGCCLTAEAIAELARRHLLAGQLEAAAPRILDSRDYPAVGDQA